MAARSPLPPPRLLPWAAVCLTLACGHLPPRATAYAAPPVRLLVLPPVSLAAAGPVPLKALRAQVEAALSARGVELIPDEQAETFLTSRRIRYMAGVEREEALDALHDLGATGILLTTVLEWQQGPLPRFALLQRVVQTGTDPRLLWADGRSSYGDESPGLLDLGVVTDVQELVARDLKALAASLQSSLAGAAPLSRTCELERRFAPWLTFRSSLLEGKRRLSMAVLPFVNHTDRRFAGDLAAQIFSHQLATLDAVEILEPGVVREDLLAFRVVMEGGISLDRARLVQELAGADLLLTGTVHNYVESQSGGAPFAEVTVEVFDRKNSELVWRSDSYASGSKGVWFFDAGLVGSGSELSCRMARAVAARFFTEPAKTIPPSNPPSKGRR
jgi:hypothetical protein